MSVFDRVLGKTTESVPEPKPKKPATRICPIMSISGKLTPCIAEECQLWNRFNNRCFLQRDS